MSWGSEIVRRLSKAEERLAALEAAGVGEHPHDADGCVNRIHFRLSDAAEEYAKMAGGNTREILMNAAKKFYEDTQPAPTPRETYCTWCSGSLSAGWCMFNGYDLCLDCREKIGVADRPEPHHAPTPPEEKPTPKAGDFWIMERKGYDRHPVLVINHLDGSNVYCCFWKPFEWRERIDLVIEDFLRPATEAEAKTFWGR